MWQIRAILISMAGVLLVLAPQVRADGLQLKNGNFVQGKYLGGTERVVQFEANGRIRMYNIGEILSINFGSADGGMPSCSAEPKASANTGLRFTDGNNVGMQAALWNSRKPGKAPAQPIAWRQAGSSGTKNSERNKHASASAGQAEGIVRQRFAIIPD